MRLLLSENKYVPFNLALEEYLLKEKDEDYLLLYISDLCVVCGKHQNLMAEISPWYCYDQSIPTYRRISGGGTVVHDPGNINFSYILNSSEGKQVDFEKYTLEIIDFLQEIGIQAYFGGHNSILANGLKISGNAEHVWKKRVLHHGTLLVNTDLDILSACLKANSSIYESKAVRSVPAKIGNLSSMLSSPPSIQDFLEQLVFFIELRHNIKRESVSSSISEYRHAELINNKYANIDWIFGYSPPYRLQNRLSDGDEIIHLSLNIAKGRIEDATLTIGQKVISDDQLAGIWHAPFAFGEIVEKTKLKEFTGRQEMRNLFF